MAYTSNRHIEGFNWGFHMMTGSFVRFASRVRNQRRRHKTEKLLASLPVEIRKDIGWPTNDGTSSQL